MPLLWCWHTVLVFSSVATYCSFQSYLRYSWRCDISYVHDVTPTTIDIPSVVSPSISTSSSNDVTTQNSPTKTIAKPDFIILKIFWSKTTPPLFFDCTLVIVYWTWCRLYATESCSGHLQGLERNRKRGRFWKKPNEVYHDCLMIFHVKLINRE